MSAMRRDRNKLNSAGSFSSKWVLPQSFVRLAWRRNSVTKLSFQAQQRLAFLEFNQVVKDVSLTCRIFKISRQTFASGREDTIQKIFLPWKINPKLPKTEEGLLCLGKKNKT